ncbi:MAG: ABC transporter ATP-binding protein [Coriobacteriia bacterium]|nr:ABC transporter ATP-binding protein [Coriobacteriia bacterium]
MFKVEAKDLSFAYPDEPDRNVLEDVNLQVGEGEFVCLLGQSGCGKSTFLRLLAGLGKPTQGQLLVDEKPIEGTSLERSVVFQDYGMFPWMTAGENILLAMEQKYPKEPRAALRERALHMLTEVGLDPAVFNKLPKELSGGMKQRCAIARSFAINPPILLMDEPFGALDAVTRARLQDMVLDLWSHEETKKTVFFVTHDVEEALLLATRIVVFGQSPSHIIFNKVIPPTVKHDRDHMYRSEEIIQLRTELVEYINRDVQLHTKE